MSYKLKYHIVIHNILKITQSVYRKVQTLLVHGPTFVQKLNSQLIVFNSILKLGSLGEKMFIIITAIIIYKFWKRPNYCNSVSENFFESFYDLFEVHH